jgi:hypothetical protein
MKNAPGCTNVTEYFGNDVKQAMSASIHAICNVACQQLDMLSGLACAQT